MSLIKLISIENEIIVRKGKRNNSEKRNFWKVWLIKFILIESGHNSEKKELLKVKIVKIVRNTLIGWSSLKQ